MPNIPNLIVMIRPASFGFNSQTAASNFFQNQQMATGDAPLMARREFDNMTALIRQKGIRVKIFEDRAPGLPDSVFSNNWMAQLPDLSLAIFPMLTENRREEVRQDIIDWIKTETHTDAVIDLRSYLETGRYLEGTGSIVFDYRNKVAYACESPRTDIALFEHFCQQIGYAPVSFLALDLNGNPVYHTNVVMTVCDRYALVCFDAIEDPVERSMLHLRLEETGHDIVPLSFAQMNSFAANCIEVLSEDQQSYLLMSTTAEASLNDLQKFTINKHSKILPLEIPTIEQVGGGSVRCTITGLFSR